MHEWTGGSRTSFSTSWGGQVYDLLQLWEDRILTNVFRIRLRDGELPPPPEEVATARETAKEPEEPLSPQTTAALLEPCKESDGDFTQVGPFLNLVYRREPSNTRNTATVIFLLFLVLMLGKAKAGEKSPPSTYTHTAASSTEGRCSRRIVFCM